ncbi:MAG: exodeoxyribonuclease V subunit beta [Gammaproteobacteria bacterium]
MDIEPAQFDAAQTELLKGANLIEASAGTGKTYAITQLVLRFVVECDIPLDQQLIVTFTNAATEELKSRIRSRLAEARRVLSAKAEGGDETLVKWARRLTVERSLALRRLELALLDIDRAGIFTIHGFCQRVLREHAMESGQLFDSELVEDIDEIRRQVADDFWREQVYLRSPLEASVLTARFPTPDDLLESVASVGRRAAVFPAAPDLNESLRQLPSAVEAACAAIERSLSKLAEAISGDVFKPEFSKKFNDDSGRLKAWLEDQSRPMPDIRTLNRLTREGLIDQLNGNKFRRTKAQTGEQRKREYIDALGLDSEMEAFGRLAKAVDRVALDFRRTLVDYLREGLDRRLRQSNVLSFDDLIGRLSDALKSTEGGGLVLELRRRFTAALIDEFQDTDQMQWHIFSTLFASGEHYFYLIGDPKQAIYKFRGADIYSYFSARETANRRYTLKKNWRSHPLLVDAVNRLFGRRPNPFLFEWMDYFSVVAALSPANGTLLRDRKPLPPMMLWQLAQNPEHNNGYWSSGKAGWYIGISVANEILVLLNRKGPAEIVGEGGSRVLRPGDIAVLVRSNRQAAEYQSILRQAGIPSVLNSTESVFATGDAFDLLAVIQAVARPGDLALLKRALVLDWFGLDGQAMYRLINDEAELDLWLSRFQQYYQIWQDKGLMAMMRKLLAEEAVTVRLSRTETAERRLTNLNHLIELAQQAAVDGNLGVQKTLQWLQAACNGEPGKSEERQLRLESDENAVKIVTMHRAKGLEYPVVFCPCLWRSGEALTRNAETVTCHEEGQMVVDIGSELFEARREHALYEELAEDLRLLYVALTRAKFRCYAVWADVRNIANPNASAMAYLLHANGGTDWRRELAEADFSEHQSRLTEFAEKFPESFEYALMEPVDRFEGLYRPLQDAGRLSVRERTRPLSTHWQMSSFTALAGLSLHDAPEIPLDKAQEVVAGAFIEQGAPEGLPAGAHTGNVVHELLENAGFDALARGDDIVELRDSACRRYGLVLERPEAIDEMLNKVVRTPLSPDAGFQLSSLDPARCLKEMPFYLALPGLNTAEINSLLQGSPAYRPLSGRRMEGFLTGFIDLVCEYRGMFYVVDYKTNALPDYGPETLMRAMQDHNYGLQYWIYSAVLHLYLRRRVGNYRTEKHFGGVRYLFVRGMQPESPMSGVFSDRPEAGRIEALAELLGGAR